MEKIIDERNNSFSSNAQIHICFTEKNSTIVEHGDDSVEVLEYFKTLPEKRNVARVVSIFLPRDRMAPRIASSVCLMFLPNAESRSDSRFISNNKFYYHELLLHPYCGGYFLSQAI